MRTILVILYLFVSFFPSGVMFSQNDSIKIKDVVNKTEFSGNWYLVYKNNISEKNNYFGLKRGYITLKTGLSDRISVRYTQDITIDNEGSDAGNVEFRMKYIYMKLKPFLSGGLKNSYFEFGIVHRPYVYFEQNINEYRSQGRMFIEKNGIVNTAGFGFMYSGMIGGKLDKEAIQKTGDKIPGKYGSFAAGVYNGGGYHSLENNRNKTVEGRLSLRPLPEILPEFQISYAGIYGKGNTEANNDFIMNLGMLSFQNKNFVLTAQYYSGRGDYEGLLLTEAGISAVNEGYSVFGEYRITKTPVSVFGRYDNFSSNMEGDYLRESYFAGISYRFLKSKVFVCYEEDLTADNKNGMFELVLDVVF